MELWNAVVNDSFAEGRSVFFPQTAYLRLKTGLIADPAGDYSRRLVAFYRLDLEAYHAFLGSEPGHETLVKLAVPQAAARFIAPGQCENLIGYWHLGGARFVYSQEGTVHSFAVASLISWRNSWYVVHLGPNPRPTDTGTVDQPATGPGTAGPPGGC